MLHPLDAPIRSVARALRAGRVTATELVDEALRRRREHDPPLDAYKVVDEDFARAQARRADERIAAARRGGPEPGPMCGIPVSVKDLYGVRGLPTFAGTPRALPERWTEDAWLVGRLRDQGAVIVGKTHTVEMAYAGVGINPHWSTPRNPWDGAVHRIPGGSSSGAGVSLREGSALVALGTDTGGSIRIPASLTGTVGMRSTTGRWPTDGVVPLSPTLDSVGGLTRTVQDLAWFFGAVDPVLGDAEAFLDGLEVRRPLRIGVPGGRLWEACEGRIARVLGRALETLTGVHGNEPADGPTSPPWTRIDVDGARLDEAADAYMSTGIASAELVAFLRTELPGWQELLHPIVGDRVRDAASLDSDEYRSARRLQADLAARAGELFREADVLALPGHTLRAPPVDELGDPARYREVNAALLRATAPASFLGLPAITIPVGLDRGGLPVGLQLVGQAGRDEDLLAAALAAERRLRTLEGGA